MLIAFAILTFFFYPGEGFVFTEIRVIVFFNMRCGSTTCKQEDEGQRSAPQFQIPHHNDSFYFSDILLFNHYINGKTVPAFTKEL
jgi:hypothetical protein